MCIRDRSERFPDTIEKDWIFVAEYERIRNNDDDEPREEPEIEIEEETPEAPPVVTTPPVVTPPVVAPPVGPPEVVEIPEQATPAAAPTLPKTGSVGAGEMAGLGALLMAIGVLLKKKKGF